MRAWEVLPCGMARREDPHEVSEGVGCHADALLEGNQLGGKEWGRGRGGEVGIQLLGKETRR